MTEVEPQFLEVVSTSAQEMRTAFGALQEGVLSATDMKVVASVVGRSVDVPQGVGYVQGDNIADQGLYRIRNDPATKNSAAFETGGITANAAGNPRIDQIVARVYDQTADGSGMRKWRFEVVTGTAAAGATLDNRSGVASLPPSAMLLADVLVPAGASSIVAGNIRDRRPWARGAQWAAASAADASTASGTLANTNAFAERVELSGMPFRVRLTGQVYVGTADLQPLLAVYVDGVELARVNPGAIRTAPAYVALDRVSSGAIGAGSHVFSLWMAIVTGGTSLALYAGAQLLIEEMVRPNARNN